MRSLICIRSRVGASSDKLVIQIRSDAKRWLNRKPGSMQVFSASQPSLRGCIASVRQARGSRMCAGTVFVIPNVNLATVSKRMEHGRPRASHVTFQTSYRRRPRRCGLR